MLKPYRTYKSYRTKVGFQHRSPASLQGLMGLFQPHLSRTQAATSIAGGNVMAPERYFSSKGTSYGQTNDDAGVNRKTHRHADARTRYSYRSRQSRILRGRGQKWKRLSISIMGTGDREVGDEKVRNPTLRLSSAQRNQGLRLNTPEVRAMVQDVQWP